MASSYAFLENESTAKIFLMHKYSPEKAKTLAYRNVHAFTSYIKQGLSLFATVKNCDFWSKPLLLYYGMMSLLKAVALTMDSGYPQSTSILQHGLTSPKRKKTPYRFYHDEIRIQKDGFFAYLCHLFHYPVSTGERYKVDVLCSFLPDLTSIVEELFHKQTQWRISIQFMDNQLYQMIVPNAVLDRLCLSAKSFTNHFNFECKETPFELHSETPTSFILTSELNPEQHPWIYNQINGDYSLWIRDSHQIKPLPEILAQYALLYSLGMLCRYDPPLWRELFSDTEQDQLLIEELIAIVEVKFPGMILQLFQME